MLIHLPVCVEVGKVVWGDTNKGLFTYYVITWVGEGYAKCLCLLILGLVTRGIILHFLHRGGGQKVSKN